MKRLGIVLLFFSFQQLTTIAFASAHTENSVYINQADTLQPQKSETQFKNFEGKIIRKVIVSPLGFDKKIPDLQNSIDTKAAKTGNNLHSFTREKIVRENIFIKPGSTLNPQQLADNERWLRDQNFMLDSRIYISPVANTDSVDVVVITRDVFSLGAFVLPTGNNDVRFGAQEGNLFGTAQKIQFTGVYNSNNQPNTGVDFLYQKTNLFGAYLNLSYQYTELDDGRSIGSENESASIFRVSRPLYNPFARWTGALELSNNWSRNIEQKDAGKFADYRYNIGDVWFGYTFGWKKNSTSTRMNRNRVMIAARYYNQHFDNKPDIPLSFEDSVLYSDRKVALGQATLFKQNFYKTQYLNGFGRTEDVAVGYRISLLGGWERTMNIERPYMGADILVSTMSGKGVIYNYGFKVGNYLRDDLIEDALGQISVNRYSRIVAINKSRLRNFTEVSFASQLNQTLKPKLDINNANGVMGSAPDSLQGSKRMYLRNETVLYTALSPFGFHLAPLVNIDLAFLGKQYDALMRKEHFYSGFTLGLRMRNENLIFNTVELRGTYYPKTVEGIEHWQAQIKISKLLKYPTALVKAPTTVYDSIK